VSDVDRGEAESFQEVGDDDMDGGGSGLGVGASTQGREVVAQREAKPVCQMSSWAASRGQLVTKLFCTEGLGSGSNTGEAEAAEAGRGVQLIHGQPLKAASPQESAHCCIDALEGRFGKVEKLGKIPEL
jgi:hypothetical protein